MQPTGGAYKPYENEIRATAAAEFALVDVDSANISSISASDTPVPFASVEQASDGITSNTLKITTLEPQIWKLDGTFVLPRQEGNGETGYVSSMMSDASGDLSPALTLTVTLNGYHTSDSFTIIGDTKIGADALLDSFTIAAYRGNTLVNSATVTGNRDIYKVVPCPAQNYNKVILTATKTVKPYRRARITEILFGRVQHWDGGKIINLRTLYESSLYSEKLPSNRLELTIDNSDHSYNVLNPDGVFAYLQEGQGINASISIGGFEVSMGRFFFSTAAANNDALTATITAYDALWSLDSSTYENGQSGTWTFSEAVAAIVANSGVNVAIDIPASIGSRVIRKCIPTNTTHREALRMAAQAAKTVLKIDRLNQITAVDYDFSDSVDFFDRSNTVGEITARDTGLINFVQLTAADQFAGHDTVYTAENQREGEPLQKLLVDNPLANGQDVAEWILSMCAHRRAFTISSLGNPARDSCDIAEINTIFGDTIAAAVTKQQTTFDGSVLDAVEAIG